MPPPLRILAMMEAASVTGPAKNLIGFCSWLQTPAGAQTGIEISIATFDRVSPGGTNNLFIDATRAAGIPTYVIREQRRFDPGVIPQLHAIVEQVRPDFVQTHNGKSHLLLKSLRALRRHRHWLAFQHGYQDTDLKLRLYNQLDRLSLRSADRVVSVCHAFARRLMSYGVQSERIRILHNAAQPVPATSEDAKARLRATLRITGDESVILAIGRLSREKGHAVLVRALHLLRSGPAETKLVLVGTGPERGSLEDLARSLGVSERTTFAGFHEDVAAFYAIADVLVLPSYSEGSSNVLLEAMMARVPIVATRAGGNPEIVLDGRTGLLVPAGDPGGIAASITRLRAEPALSAALTQAAYTRAVNEFSVDHYRNRLLSYYHELSGQAARR